MFNRHSLNVVPHLVLPDIIPFRNSTSGYCLPLLFRTTLEIAQDVVTKIGKLPRLFTVPRNSSFNMFCFNFFYIHYMFRPLWAILSWNIQLLNHRKLLCLQRIRCSVCF
jgi:hypothetical protein